MCSRAREGRGLCSDKGVSKASSSDLEESYAQGEIKVGHRPRDKFRGDDSMGEVATKFDRSSATLAFGGGQGEEFPASSY